MKLLNKNIVKKLRKKKLKISLAESCTGGLLSSAITSISGASKIFNLGLIAYSNQCKIKVLKVPKKTIKKYGAVSEEVCKIMAENVSKIGKTNMSVSVTGIAGPNGGTRKKPVGLVYIGIKKNNIINIKKYLFKNKGRSYIQKAIVNKCLRLVLSILE
jgi:PncC family amidohydrolase|tara:strand:+ start:3860 stop:4333 length:474 start_codon:yes stop_codon:yes gene_type:complete